MDIETVAVLTIWDWENKKSYAKKIIICEDWDAAYELAQMFEEDTTIDDHFENEEDLKEYIEELRS